MMLEEDLEKQKQQTFIDSDISTISPNLPCDDCICYALCRPKVLDEWKNGFVNTMDDSTKALRILQWLSNGCSLVDNYVSKIERYDSSAVTVSVSAKRCTEVVMFLINDNGGA